MRSDVVIVPDLGLQLPVYALMMQAVMTTVVFILVAGFAFRDQLNGTFMHSFFWFF